MDEHARPIHWWHRNHQLGLLGIGGGARHRALLALPWALAAATTFFRDVRHFLEIGLMIMFWTTPILYDYQKVPDAWRWPVLLSPMSPFVLAYQQIFYYGRLPDPEVAKPFIADTETTMTVSYTHKTLPTTSRV